MTKTWRSYITVIVITVVSSLYSLPNIFGEAPAIELSSKVGSRVRSSLVSELNNKLAAMELKPARVIKDKGKATLIFENGDQQIRAKNYIDKNYLSALNSNLNLVSRSPSWLSAIGAYPMKLGLDLRGGIHLLLSVDINSMLLTQATNDLNDIRAFALKEKIDLKESEISPETSTIWLSTGKLDALYKKLKDRYTNLDVEKLDGKIQINLNLNEKKAISDYVMDKTISTLNNRVNELGVAEAVIQRQGFDQISVDLPGIQDAARAHSIIGKTATLKFYLQDMTNSPTEAEKNGAPLGSKLFYYGDNPVLLEDKPVLTGDSIAYATSTMSEGSPMVVIRLGKGGNDFNTITAKNIGRPLASVYVERKQHVNMVRGKPTMSAYNYERIINIATIRSALGNNFQISGINSPQEASELALLLRSGALAAPVNIVQETSIGPSLGQDNINQGILSLEIGALLVVVFMLLYYRVFGLVANLAISLNILMIVAALSLIGMTLTLPGIAGIVLTVGMAVDANVLINERIREELRKGVSNLKSISYGYEQAFATIVDSNVTTLIVAIILFGIGSGSIRGFAVTLIIGLLCSLFTSVTFTRLVVDLIYNKKNPLKKLSIGI